MSGSKTRLDQAMVDRGMARSRARAQEIIAQGLVLVDGVPARKASQGIPEEAVLSLSGPDHPWVSRAALKLVAALDTCPDIPVTDTVALDLGASTGGFTQVLRARGARLVHAVDVGHGQIHPDVAADPGVRVREGTDVRSLTPQDLVPAPQLVTADLSFIGLDKALPVPLGLVDATTPGWLIALIKPQFQLERADIGKGGIVRNPEAVARANAKVCACVEGLGWQVQHLLPSPVTGSDGNRETLLIARREAFGA